MQYWGKEREGKGDYKFIFKGVYVFICNILTSWIRKYADPPNSKKLFAFKSQILTDENRDC